MDEHNGRFCKTPEFPNGVYAYFAGVSTDGMGVNLNGKQTFKSAYPYFVGNTYKSEFIPENFVLNHDFDFKWPRVCRYGKCVDGDVAVTTCFVFICILLFLLFVYYPI